jgi:hypothetical protein
MVKIGLNKRGSMREMIQQGKLEDLLAQQKKAKEELVAKATRPKGSKTTKDV